MFYSSLFLSRSFTSILDLFSRFSSSYETLFFLFASYFGRRGRRCIQALQAALLGCLAHAGGLQAVYSNEGSTQRQQSFDAALCL